MLGTDNMSGAYQGFAYFEYRGTLLTKLQKEIRGKKR
jgi:hypothetical protein